MGSAGRLPADQRLPAHDRATRAGGEPRKDRTADVSARVVRWLVPVMGLSGTLPRMPRGEHRLRPRLHRPARAHGPTRQPGKRSACLPTASAPGREAPVSEAEGRPRGTQSMLSVKQEAHLVALYRSGEHVRVTAHRRGGAGRSGSQPRPPSLRGGPTPRTRCRFGDRAAAPSRAERSTARYSLTSSPRRSGVPRRSSTQTRCLLRCHLDVRRERPPPPGRWTASCEQIPGSDGVARSVIKRTAWRPHHTQRLALMNGLAPRV